MRYMRCAACNVNVYAGLGMSRYKHGDCAAGNVNVAACDGLSTSPTSFDCEANQI